MAPSALAATSASTAPATNPIPDLSGSPTSVLPSYSTQTLASDITTGTVPTTLLQFLIALSIIALIVSLSFEIVLIASMIRNRFRDRRSRSEKREVASSGQVEETEDRDRGKGAARPAGTGAFKPGATGAGEGAGATAGGLGGVYGGQDAAQALVQIKGEVGQIRGSLEGLKSELSELNKSLRELAKISSGLVTSHFVDFVANEFLKAVDEFYKLMEKVGGEIEKESPEALVDSCVSFCTPRERSGDRFDMGSLLLRAERAAKALYCYEVLKSKDPAAADKCRRLPEFLYKSLVDDLLEERQKRGGKT